MNLLTQLNNGNMTLATMSLDTLETHLERATGALIDKLGDELIYRQNEYIDRTKFLESFL